MRIAFSPQRRDDALTLEKTNGDRLRINGELFNFNALNDGDVIPARTIPCEWITGPVEKVDGEVRLTVILPHGPNPSQGVAFPEPITVTDDGPITVPHDLTVEEMAEMVKNPDISRAEVLAIDKRAKELGWGHEPHPWTKEEMAKQEPSDVDA